jgi:hypothetical protein
VGVAVPLVVVVDGRELALGPREAALVTAVLAVAQRYRHERTFRIGLHVNHAKVSTDVTLHVADVAYCSSVPD